jgi:predicted nucleic acid-binding protein
VPLSGEVEMVQRILVDTDVLIDAGRAVEVAVVQLESAAQKSTLAVSIITQMELLVGCRNRTELQIMERFLERFEIIKLSEAISDKAIDLLRNYRLSHVLLIADALIAATAIVTDAPLLSKNQRDYRACIASEFHSEGKVQDLS